MESTSRKIWEKVCISPCCGDKINTYHDGSLVIPLELQENVSHFLWHSHIFWLFLVCGCFVSTVRWRYSLFIPFSPWRNPRLRHFAGYPFGVSRKTHQPFSITQPFNIGFVIVYGCFVLVMYWKYMLFLQIFRWWALWLGDFIGYFFGISRK